MPGINAANAGFAIVNCWATPAKISAPAAWVTAPCTKPKGKPGVPTGILGKGNTPLNFISGLAAKVCSFLLPTNQIS